MHRRYITPTPRPTGSNGRGSDMPVTLIIGLSNARPNTVHQIVVTLLAVVEAAVGLSKRVRLLAGGHQISLWRESGDNGSHFSTSDEVAGWFSVHDHNSF